MVQERNSLSLFSSGCPHRAAFVSFCGMIGEPFGVRLPVPRIEGADGVARLRFVKEFCGGFLDNPSKHLWHRSTAALERDSRMSIAMSLFLFRKALPSSDVDLGAYVLKMSTPAPEPDPGFLAYVRRTVPQLFPQGWDLSLYPSAALSAVLPIKSCLQRGLSKGGCRREALRDGGRWSDHQSYVLEVLTREAPLEFLPSRVCSVETGGKKRIVSVSDVGCNVMRPLHTAIYNRLSKFPWLLRGDAKPSRFREFWTRPGEVFVSGDYESATDNLNHTIQDAILRCILDTSVSVPKGIKESAPQMLSSLLSVGNSEPVRQKRGQLMGNLLSFPLLCLVNYLAFRYFSKSNAPVRINGDDIVFRATPEVANRWMESVSLSGLTLSRGKTMVDRRYFSLNSCLFKSLSGGVRLVPFVRSTAFGYRSSDDKVASLAGRFRSFCPGFFGERRSLLRVSWLRWNTKYVRASARSLTRGLGINVNYSELVRSSLWDREAWYLSLPAEPPMPVRRCVLDQARIPEGYELREVSVVTKEIRRLGREAAGSFVELAWSPVTGLFNDSDYAERVRSGCANFYGWLESRLSLSKRARLLGLSPRNCYRYLRPPRSLLPDSPRNRRKKVWLPVGFGRGMCMVREQGWESADGHMLVGDQELEVNL